MLLDTSSRLEGWKNSRCPQVELADLLSRNPTAHKWKVTYRCLVLREALLWRQVDLLSECHSLIQAGHILGPTVLLRAAFETLAVLIYLNDKTAAVADGAHDFFEFDSLTMRLMMGTKDKSTSHEAVNIVSVLDRCDKKYPGLKVLYASLSEAAHPNCEGVTLGYSAIDRENHRTSFSARWPPWYSERLPTGVELCLNTFEIEYNHVWPATMERLENWLTTNDSALERRRKGI